MSAWEPWSPAYAPHVLGRYTVREFDPETGLAEEQQVEATCSRCHATFQRRCASGLVRDHIARFALVHTHRDPLQAERIERPTSLRRHRGPDGDYE